MSNTIPPLLCSTPPPIDFDGGGGSGSPDNDDFETFESADSVYGQFDGPSKTNTPQHSLNNAKDDLDLPIPDFTPFPTSLKINTTIDVKLENIKDDPGGVAETTQEIFDDPHPEIKDTSPTFTDTSPEQNYKSISTKDPIEFIISEPPPVDVGYSSESQSPKNSRGDSPLSLEFSPGNISDDDSIDFQIENESRYDDNTSLPSLKFDAINNISKSATPIPEDKSNEKSSGPDVEKTADAKEECSNTSAFETPASASEQEENVLSATLVPSDLTDSHDPNDRIASEQFPSEDCWNQGEDIESPSSKSDSGVIEEPIIDQREPVTDDLNETVDDFDSKDDHHQPDEMAPNEANLDTEVGASTEFEEFTSFSWSDPAPSTSAIDKSNDGEFTFEADFSQADFPAFEMNFPTPSGAEISTLPTDPIDLIVSDDDDFDDFDDFQDFATADVDKPKIDHEYEAISTDIAAIEEKNICENADDDDFGDFNDFQESSTSDQTTTVAPSLPIISPAKIDEKVKTVLDEMFPADSDLSSSAESSNIIRDLPKLSDNELTVNLREIDTAKALEYQWLRSSMKNSLVKSLGIDSRNILYGEKWNASMPRFAANLGCGPLEPLKPMRLGSDNVLMRSSKATHSSVETEKPTSSSSQVPAVKFDWNSSGLVNPLDGVKEILHERKTETIHPSQPDDTDRSGDPSSTDKNSAKAEQTIAANITSLSSVDNDLKPLETTASKVPVTIETNIIVDENFKYGEQYTESSPTILTTSKFIPLKETHIFTPSKSENSISRSVNKTVSKGPIDFDYEIAAAGIVINEQVVKKEYRDVVYNLEAQTNDCTAVMPATDVMPVDSRSRLDHNLPIVDPNKTGFRQTSLATDLLSGPILNIMKKKPEAVSAIQSDLRDEFSDFQGSVSEPPSSCEPTTKSKANITPKSVVKSPDDDDFTEFQSVPPPHTSQQQQKSFIADKPKSRTGTPSLSEEMILSPAVLLPQAIKLQSSGPKIHWPSDSDINPEELARLEQLFPQAKHTAQQQSVFSNNSASATPIPHSSPMKEKRDDDDWSDFVSVQPSSVNSVDSRLQDRPIPSASKLSTISKTYDDDDWSDFVSGTPASVSNIGQPVNKSHWNSVQLPPPQFSSWNQSPAAYNHLPQVFASVPSAPASQQQFNNMTTVPTMPANNLYQTNHNNNQFLLNGRVNSTPVGHFQQHHDTKGVNHLQYQQQMHLNQQQQKQQQHQRINVNLNANVNVLRSQLNMAPSISLIPDLGFAAPKSLVNLSRTNAHHKK